MSQAEDRRSESMTAATAANHAGVAPDDSRIIRALQEYQAALRAGHKPSRSEFQVRYPDIAEALAECLDGLEFVHGVAPHLSDPGLALSAAPEIRPEGPLGDFRIVREIGRGGMGVVYEAVQISLGRRVALKVLPFAAAMDPKQLQRFKNEAQAAAHLHHTNIVPVISVGCERGVHYYAMQFIEGQTLAAVIAELRQQTGLEPRDPSHPLSEVANELASGRLAPVKRRGAAVVGPCGGEEATGPYHATTAAPHHPTTPPHPDPTTPVAALSTERSIKSAAYFRTVANLGLQAAEGLEHAHQLGVVHRDMKPANLLVDVRCNLWITDFGLAHFQNNPGLTLSGDLVGTLRYMSPEQALGKRVLIDQRTDIYSLGVTLYELLTLEPAFSGSDREEVLRQIVFEEPRAPRPRNKAIPRELETVVLKAMEKSPQGRYTTAQELADDLQRFLEDKPIRAKRPTLVQRASKWSRRHKPLVGAVMVVGFLGVLFAAANGLWLAQQRTETAGRVEEALRRAGELQTQSRWPEALEAAQRAEELLKVGGGSAELRQRVQGALVDLTMILRLDDIRLEEEPVRRLDEEAVREGGFHDLQGLSFLYAEAFRNYGIDVDALEAEEAAQRIRARSIHVELATALDHWAHVRLIKMVGTSDEPKWRHVLAVARAADRDDPWRNRLREHLGRSPEDKKILQDLAASPELGSQSVLTLHLLGNCLGDAGTVATAVSVLRQAQQSHPDNFWISKDLADYLQRLGQPGEALHFRIAALALRPHSARVHNKLGNALLNQGALKEAIAAFNGGQRFVSEDFGIDILWGDVLKQPGALEEAVAVFEEASRLKPDEAGIYINWASALMDQATLDKAVMVYDQALATLKRVCAKEPRPASIGALLHSAAYGRAEALLRLGRFEEAEQTYQQALEIDPSNHWSWYCDAALRLHLGDIEGYRRVCREMLARFSHTGDPKIAARAARTCLLVPGAVSDLRPALQLAERAVTGTQQHWAYRSQLVVKGMADYRAGDFDNAIHRLNRSLSLGPAPWYWSSRYSVGMAHVYLALAHHRLGHAEQARQALHQARLLTKPRNGKSGENEPPEDWYDWIRLHIALQEAERLLKG